MTDSNLLFKPVYKEESLILGMQSCNGGHGSLYTTASRLFLAMLCEVGAYVSIKCKAMNAK